jgi:hypothetical protein
MARNYIKNLRNYIENHRNCLGDISFRFPSESPCRFSIHGNQRSRKTTFIRIGNVPKHSHWILTSSLQLHLAVSCVQRTRLGSEWEELLTLNEKQYVVVCCSYCWAGLKKWKLETLAYVLKVLKNTHGIVQNNEEWCYMQFVVYDAHVICAMTVYIFNRNPMSLYICSYDLINESVSTHALPLLPLQTFKPKLVKNRFIHRANRMGNLRHIQIRYPLHSRWGQKGSLRLGGRTSGSSS